MHDQTANPNGFGVAIGVSATSGVWDRKTLLDTATYHLEVGMALILAVRLKLLTREKALERAEGLPFPWFDAVFQRWC